MPRRGAGTGSVIPFPPTRRHIGSAAGAISGVYGHALASRWLNLTTGFPAPFSIGPSYVLITLFLVAGIALAVIALPGLLAARVSPRAGLQE